MRESEDESHGPVRRQAGRFGAILLLLVLPLAFVGPSLLPGKRFLPLLPAAFAPLSLEHPEAARAALDRADYLTPDRVFPLLTDEIAVREAWLHGNLPAWDPRLGLGQPLCGASLCGAWYPPNLLKIVLPPDVAAGWLALLALFLAGLGLYAFLGVRGLSRGARLAGAWAVQSGGFAIANLHYGMKVDAALWLLFALWAVEGLIARRRFAGQALALSIALSWLAGFPPIAVFVSAATMLYALGRAVETKSLRILPMLTGWTALGVLAAAVQWMPMLEASRLSLRTPEEAGAVAAQSLPMSTLGTLLVPDLFGAATENVLAPHNAVAWWLTPKSELVAAQTASALEWNLFAGVTVLALAFAALVAAPRKAILPGVLLVLALGFAQGWPVLRLAYALPGFDLGAPSRANAVAWMLWPWLAALGLDALLAGPKRAWLGLLAVVAPALLGAAWLGAGASSPMFASDLQQELSARHEVPLAQVQSLLPDDLVTAAGVRLVHGASLLGAVAIAIALAALATAFLRHRGSRIRAVPWIALMALEGAFLAHEHLAPRTLAGHGSPATAALFPASDAMDAIRDAAQDGRVVRFDASASGVDEVEQLARPNLLAAYGIADLTPVTEFTPRSLIELVGSIDEKSLCRTGINRISDVKLLGKRALDLLRVTCVLSTAPIANPRLSAVFSTPGFYVYRRSGSLPIARVVPAELTLATDSLAETQLVVEEGVDVRRRAVAVADALPPESERPRSEVPPGGVFTPGDVEVSRPAPDRLDARVSKSSGGWLVFQEQAYPGWKATVNGVDAPVVSVDHVCRAVPIPPGDSIVRTKYEPGSLRTGAWISLASVALGLVVAGIATWLGARRLPAAAGHA